MSRIVRLDGLDSILLMSLAGQEGGNALLDVLTGKVTPSGKLTATWAMDYKDYPAAETFAYNDQNVDVEKYTEGIYVGYRWFDSFSKTPIYPFGYGLSYTTFDVGMWSNHGWKNAEVKVDVTNIGTKYSGKRDLAGLLLGTGRLEGLIRSLWDSQRLGSWHRAKEVLTVKFRLA